MAKKSAKKNAKNSKKIVPQTNKVKASKVTPFKKVATTKTARLQGGDYTVGDKRPPKDKQWKKGQSGNPKGRPGKLTNVIIDEMKASGVQPLKASQIIDAYEVMLNMTIVELTARANDQHAAAFVRILAKAMLSNKGFEIMNTMLDRAHGKATQKTEIDHNVKQDTNIPAIAWTSTDQNAKTE